MRLLQIPAFLEKWDLPYELVDGWQDRGKDLPDLPEVVIGHHTGGASQVNSGGRDYPSLATVRDGRGEPNPLPGPLSQVGLGFSGTVYVIAAGKANHAGKGAWKGITDSLETIGIEAESPGDGSWTPEQRVNYPILAAALLDMLGQPADMFAGHREWALPAGRKPDPVGWDLPAMRETINRFLLAGPNPITTIDYPPEDKMVLLENDGENHWFTVRLDMTAKKSVADKVSLDAMLKRKDLYATVGLSRRQLDAIPTVVK